MDIEVKKYWAIQVTFVSDGSQCSTIFFPTREKMRKTYKYLTQEVQPFNTHHKMKVKEVRRNGLPAVITMYKTH